MNSLRRQTRLLRLFAAAVVLVLQTVANAHELEHALNHHDEPTCALHLYNGCAAKPPVAAADLPSVAIDTVHAIFLTPPRPATNSVFAYHGRAPPRLVLRVV